MINRPTTPQILRDIAEELNREIMPLMPGSTEQIRLFMIAAVIGQCAERADREIALMADETAQYRAYTTEVARQSGNAALARDVEAIGEISDLHLDAVAATYARASEAFSTALEVAMDAGLADLIAAGEELLRLRVTNEQAMAAVASAGR